MIQNYKAQWKGCKLVRQLKQIKAAKIMQILQGRKKQIKN